VLRTSQNTPPHTINTATADVTRRPGPNQAIQSASAAVHPVRAGARSRSKISGALDELSEDAPEAASGSTIDSSLIAALAAQTSTGGSRRVERYRSISTSRGVPDEHARQKDQ
jgi:flagellum-specific peptidoglycan hydrolase FlgJ